MRKIILTKKRLKALDMAISLDDVLLEKYRRLREDLAEYEKTTLKRLGQRKNYKIVELKGNTKYLKQIKDIISTDEGTIIII